MSSFLVLREGDTRNRWRDGQVCPGDEKKERREREEPGLGWRKGKSPALDEKSLRGELWLEWTGRERERKGFSPRLEWKDDERRWR
ncbi:hypothetical protein TNCV_672021 [Trichonephila clavipes]|nr:hypothetical protein TNCV_672021 [Trichonephila clavipes]